MAFSGYVLVSSPDGTDVRQLFPSGVWLSHTLGEPASCTMTFDHHGDLLEAETSGCLQVKSYVKLIRNSTNEFMGTVRNKRVTVSGGVTSVTIVATDFFGDLGYTAASIAGELLFTFESTYTEFGGGFTPGSDDDSAINMLSANTASAAIKGYYYIDPVASATAWRAISSSPRAIYDTVTDAQTDSISVSSTDKSFRAQGFIHNTAKIRYYDGYGLDGGFYKFANTLAAFGTNNTWAVGNECNQFVPKRWRNDSTFALFGWTGTAWVNIGPSSASAESLDINWEEGRIEFADIADTLTRYDGFHVHVNYYDEDDADAKLLGGSATYGLIEKLLTETHANNGPQFDEADLRPAISVSVDRISLGSVACVYATNTRDFIETVISDLGYTSIDSAATHKHIAIWFDPQTGTNGTLYIKQLTQSASAEGLGGAVIGIDKVYDIEDVFSGVVYTFDKADNTRDADVVKLADTLATSKTVAQVGVKAKIIDANIGSPVYYFERFGRVSEWAAITEATRSLKESWKKNRSQVYRMTGAGASALPMIGDTLCGPDGYRGIVIQRTYEVQNGTESSMVELLDITQVIG